MDGNDLDTRLDALVHRDQDQVSCPFPLFDDLRAASPVHYSDELGAWVLTRHADCLAVLHDPLTWSVRMRTGPKAINEVLADRVSEIADDPASQYLIEGLARVTSRVPMLSSADPPLHAKQRKLVNPTFKPRRIRAMEPLIQSLTDDLLDGLPTGTTVGFVAAFAVPLPMTVIAHALGVADDDLGRFKEWSDNLVMPVGNQHPSRVQVEGYLRTQIQFTDFFRATIAAKREDPGDDLISDIATAAIDGEELSEVERLDVISQLLAAGNETTTKLITDIVWRLAASEDLQAQVRTNPGLVVPLVEEVLRLDAPVAGLFRQATRDTELGGQEIKRGEHVWVLYAAANRDGERWTDPHLVDLERSDQKDHLGFGHGHHYCLGANLARTEARIAIESLLDRTDNIALAEHNDFRFEDSYLLRGLRELNVVLS